jgi:hypothetical protein
VAGFEAPNDRTGIGMVRRLVPPPVSPARGPPTDRGEFFSAWAHDDRDVFQPPHDQRPVIDIHSL